MVRASWLVCALGAALAAGAARAVPPEACDAKAGPCWTPPVGARWQYQLEAKGRKHAASGGIDVGLCAKPAGGGPCVAPDVFDIDLWVDPSLTDGAAVVNRAAVEAIHAAGKRAVCYVQAGTAERFRPDYPAFVAFDEACGGCLLGEPFSPVFPDEHWLNLNDDEGQRAFVLGIVEARVALCAGAGFDGVEFDVVDAWAQGAATTGWEISYDTQLEYDQQLANLAHRHGLTAALKNDLGQLGALLPFFDYAVNEQCFEFDECDGYAAWIAAGKAVFAVEYRVPRRHFCEAANAAGFGAIKKARSASGCSRDRGSPAGSARCGRAAQRRTRERAETASSRYRPKLTLTSSLTLPTILRMRSALPALEWPRRRGRWQLPARNRLGPPRGAFQGSKSRESVVRVNGSAGS